MFKHLDLTIAPWPDYELLDSGDNRKLERYGKIILVRPETQAIWSPRQPELWKKADAEFVRSGEKGEWKTTGTKKLPESWELSWHDITFSVRPTSFKHTGVFPEQAANWEWLREKIHALENPNVLNLFGYTGIASVVAAKACLQNRRDAVVSQFRARIAQPDAGIPSAVFQGGMGGFAAETGRKGARTILETGLQHGAHITHVDASKQSNAWAKENAELSGIPTSSIRFLLDDALKFVEREARRGAMYDGIILDPPAFGRGAKGEVWHIEEHLPRLLAALEKIFSKKSGSSFLLNGYAAGYSPQSFLQAVEGNFPEKISEGEFGELHIPESDSKRVIPAGIYVRFVR